MICITSARFNMKADILRPVDSITDLDNLENGEWISSQDVITGDIVRVWRPLDNPNTIGADPTFGTINCIARGIVDGGIRVAGTTERFEKEYLNIDFVKMWVSSRTLITKRDRITNIRSKAGVIIWRDEEFEGGTPRATVFNVNGVTPLFDAFNKHVENFVLLERAEI